MKYIITNIYLWCHLKAKGRKCSLFVQHFVLLRSLNVYRDHLHNEIYFKNLTPVLLQRSSEGGRDLWTCSRNEIYSGLWRGHLRSAGLNKYTRRNHVSQKVCNCIRMWHKGPSLYPIPSQINLLHIPQIHWNNICWKAQVKKICSLFHCYFVSSISVPNMLKIFWSLLIYGQIGDASIYQTSNDGVAATMNWMNVEESGLRMWDWEWNRKTSHPRWQFTFWDSKPGHLE